MTPLWGIYLSLREKRPYWDIFWSVFPRIRTEYGEIRSTVSGLNAGKCGPEKLRIRTLFTQISRYAK